MKTVEEIRQIAEEARPDLDSYRNCSPINPIIQEALEKEGVSVECITGRIDSTVRGGGEEHVYLRVNSNDVKNVESDVIVDGALDQFCEERYQASVWVNLGPKEEIPCPAVLTKDDELFDKFTPRKPVL